MKRFKVSETGSYKKATVAATAAATAATATTQPQPLRTRNRPVYVVPNRKTVVVGEKRVFNKILNFVISFKCNEWRNLLHFMAPPRQSNASVWGARRAAVRLGTAGGRDADVAVERVVANLRTVFILPFFFRWEEAYGAKHSPSPSPMLATRREPSL